MSAARSGYRTELHLPLTGCYCADRTGHEPGSVTDLTAVTAVTAVTGVTGVTGPVTVPVMVRGGLRVYYWTGGWGGIG